MKLSDIFKTNKCTIEILDFGLDVYGTKNKKLIESYKNIDVDTDADSVKEFINLLFVTKLINNFDYNTLELKTIKTNIDEVVEDLLFIDSGTIYSPMQYIIIADKYSYNNSDILKTILYTNFKSLNLNFDKFDELLKEKTNEVRQSIIEYLFANFDSGEMDSKELASLIVTNFNIYFDVAYDIAKNFNIDVDADNINIKNVFKKYVTECEDCDYSDEEIEEVFDKIQNVLNTDIVDFVDNLNKFEPEDISWFIDDVIVSVDSEQLNQYINDFYNKQKQFRNLNENQQIDNNLIIESVVNELIDIRGISVKNIHLKIPTIERLIKDFNNGKLDNSLVNKCVKLYKLRKI